MNIKIYPYKAGSASAKALSEAVDGKVLKREGKALKADLIVNWGSSNIDRHLISKVFLNKAESIRIASNKLSSFKAFAEHDVPTVEWTESEHDAAEWLRQGHDVVIRKKLTGHSGEGIEIFTSGEGPGGLVAAPLYTKYTKKKDEYRIHVFQGEVIFQQRKARKKDVPDEEVNWQVRNLAGGFIFANDNIQAPRCVCEAAVMAVQALGLDFGAADVGFSNNKASVYEVNTACGLMGKTLEAYAEAIRHVQMD